MSQSKPSWVTQVEKERREKGMNTVSDSGSSSSGGSSPSRGSGGSSGGSGGGGYRAKGDWYGDSQMSADVQKQLQAYGDAYNAATTDEQRKAAHDAAEALRAQYGYSGGGDGSETILFPQQTPTYQPGYSKPSYVNQYQDLIDQLTGQIVDRDPFSYDYLDDPLWQQLQGSYAREGERAMQNTLGQAAARTGGMASSYAASAANQANNYYMAQLNDKIPELQQLAYSMYQDDVNRDRLNLQMIQALEQGDYAKYQDLLAQYNADRTFDYNAWRDQIGDSRYEREWDYGVGRDQMDDSRYDQETAYQQALNRWKITGTVSAADAAILGVPAGTSYGVYETAARGGSGGSSKGSGSTETSASTGDKWAAVEDWAARFGEETAEDYIREHYKELDYPSQSAALAGWRNHRLEAEDGDYSLDALNTSAVLSLGLGPVSFQTVEELVEQGKVEVYTDSSGALSVRWANGYNADNYKENSGSMTSGLQGRLDKLLGR